MIHAAWLLAGYYVLQAKCHTQYSFRKQVLSHGIVLILDWNQTRKQKFHVLLYQILSHATQQARTVGRFLYQHVSLVTCFHVILIGSRICTKNSNWCNVSSLTPVLGSIQWKNITDTRRCGAWHDNSMQYINTSLPVAGFIKPTKASVLGTVPLIH